MEDININNNYDFEDNTFSSKIDGILAVFLKKFKLEGVEILDDEELLFRNFCKENIANISWYKKALGQENKYRYLYSALSVALIIFVPVFIFFNTTFIPDYNVGNITYAQSLTGSITVIITLVLALHKLMTSWIEKRKFSSLFHQAQVDLMNILYKLESDYLYTAKVKASFSDESNIVNDQFLIDIEASIEQSRAIVAKETNEYFKMRGNPAFDLSETLKSSAISAKDLIGRFKNKNLDIEAMKEEAKEMKKKQEELTDTLANEEMNLDVKLQKLERLANKEGVICAQLEKLESLATPTDEQKLKIETLNEQYEALQTEAETLEFDCFKLRAKIKLTKSKLE